MSQAQGYTHLGRPPSPTNSHDSRLREPPQPYMFCAVGDGFEVVDHRVEGKRLACLAKAEAPLDLQAYAQDDTCCAKAT